MSLSSLSVAGVMRGLFDRSEADLGLAQSRLRHLYKWGLGGVSLAVGVYLVLVGFVLISQGYSAYTGGELVHGALRGGVNTAAMMVVMAVVLFLSFIVARYEAGMTETAQWQLLRGGAGYLIGHCLVAMLLFVGSVFAHYGNLWVFGGLRLAIPGLMVLIGAEILLTFLFSSYRPRRFEAVPRPAFDSRMLGWMTSPGSIAQAIGEAVNYQFGFEVSRSWFYRLLSKAVTPLVVFGVLTLWLMSGLVIVGPHEEMMVLRFGAVHRKPVGAGLHVKLPWPIDSAKKYRTGRVHQVLVGSTDHEIDANHAVLWSVKHVEDEDYLVTAPTPWERVGEGNDLVEEGGVSGNSLVGAQVVVQYRIVDLIRYVTATENGREILTAMAERRVNAYFVSQDIDTLLGRGRVEAGVTLMDQIQSDCDQAGLGLEIVFVGIASIHPPQEMGVASAFLEQIGAMQERQSMIEQAQQEASSTLASMAGTRAKALEINQAILDLQEQPWGQEEDDGVLALDKQSVIQSQEVKIEQLLTNIHGEAAKMIYEARADRWERVITERAMADRFSAEVAAYRYAPKYYRARRYLDAVAAGLGGARKYVLTSDSSTDPVFRLDLKDVGSTIDTIFSETQ